MSSLYHRLVTSDDSLSRFIRATYRSVCEFYLPAPRLIFGPVRAVFLFFRGIYYFLMRVCFCEPIFKMYCEKYGRNVHTGAYIHWVQGQGRLIIGDNVHIDGKSSFLFAIRYTDSPTLRIGSNVVIGHGCAFTVGREISIGDNVKIAMNVEMFDSPGHATDPELRRSGAPALQEDVKPILIDDDVWVGAGATIYPGVTIGKCSIVARRAVVMSNVSPYAIVAGNPARQIARVKNAKE